MANLQTRKHRNHRAEFDKICDEFQEQRNNPLAFAELLQRIAHSDYCVWAVAQSAAKDSPLDDSERAMIAQVIAPELAWRSPSVAYRFKELAK